MTGAAVNIVYPESDEVEDLISFKTIKKLIVRFLRLKESRLKFMKFKEVKRIINRFLQRKQN